MKIINLELPQIPEEEKTPLVLALLKIIEIQQAAINEQGELIQQLKDEIARLKNHNTKPKIKSSRLNGSNKGGGDENPDGKRPGSDKKSKTREIKIHKIETIEPDALPEGSVFKKYKEFVVQDISFKLYNTKFRLRVYETPDGSLVSGKLPRELNGKHYGGSLICFCLYQHHHCGVTQPLLLEQLHELGIEISSGQLNNILIENNEMYHNEKERILKAGLKTARYINVDDTGARHDGKNGYCTVIGNDSFTWFESTFSKSRINFLKLLNSGKNEYHINEPALDYMNLNPCCQHSCCNNI